MAALKLKGINVIAAEEGNVFLLFKGCCLSFNYVMQTQKRFPAAFPFSRGSQLSSSAASLRLEKSPHYYRLYL